jgi:DNA-binding LytR/AlgR family response regulator
MAQANRILAVDDEASVADALRVILEDEGLAVAVAVNGHDAITEARHAPFSVTATDLRLPDMDSLEVIRRLPPGRLRRRGHPVVLVAPTLFSLPRSSPQWVQVRLSVKRRLVSRVFIRASRPREHWHLAASSFHLSVRALLRATALRPAHVWVRGRAAPLL